MASFFHRRVPTPALPLLCGVLAFAHLSGAAPARAQIQPTTGAKSLGSQVNGSTSACRSGACAITGGTAAGANLFHRFDSFDTRSGITGVSIDPAGRANVILGVLSPTGTFLDSIVTLGSKANLFWLSPGGISISGGGGFRNVANLSLSTAPSLQVGAGAFNVFDTTAEQLAALTGPPGAFLPSSGRTGSIVLSDGLLELDGNLLLDADSLTTRGRNTVAAPWTLSLDTWTNEGALAFTNGGSATFLRETEWINTANGAIALGYDPARIPLESPFAGIPARGDAAVAPDPVVQGPQGGTVTLRNLGEIYKSTDSTQILSRVDLKNVPSGTDFYPPPRDQQRKADPIYTGRLEIDAGTLVFDQNSAISEQTGSIFLLFDSGLEVRRAQPLLNEGFIGGMGTLRLAQGGNGTLENRGVIAPGLRGTVGRLNIQGSVVQPASASSASIDVDIGKGGSDLLTATGRVDLSGGSIKAFGLEGYSPSRGDAFTVIDAAGGLSVATSVVQDLPPGIVSTVRDNTFYDLIAGAQLSDTQLYFLTRTRVDPFLANDQLALLTVTLDQASFGLEGFGASEGSVGSIGSTTSLDPLQTQKEFLEGETEASALTRSRLGLSATPGEGSLNPEEVQRLLRQAAERVRSECLPEGRC